MPSSSTRSTSTETALYLEYRLAYNRMNFDCETRHHCAFVTNCFADALDMLPDDLFDRLLVDTRSRAWRILEVESHKAETLCNRVAHAGSAFADASTLLERIGRAKEAERFMDWARQLRNLAEEYFQMQKGGIVEMET